MRPKVVIIVLAMGFLVLGLVAVLKGVGGKNNAAGEISTTSQPVGSAAASSGTNQPFSASRGANSVIVSDQMRAALIDRETEEIRDLFNQADGSNNVEVIAAILAKLSHPEVEVRRAALDALRQLDDTNAVPGLEKAVENTQDLREKVAILDAIDYIKMPSLTESVPTDLATNQAFFDSALRSNRVARTNVPNNPAFTKGRHTAAGEKQKPKSAGPSAPTPQPQ